MAKKFKLRSDQIKQLVSGRGACFATDMITVEGHSVGYMYREESRHAGDSGWVFMSGRETQEYINHSENLATYDVNTIANYDPDIIAFLDAPFGSAFGRDAETGEFFEVDFAPIAFSGVGTETAIAADGPVLRRISESSISPDEPIAYETCDQCGCTIETGKAVLRSKTDTEMVGYAAVHRTINLILCPKCAEHYDETGSKLMWAMLAFVAVVISVALASWCFPSAFR